MLISRFRERGRVIEAPIVDTSLIATVTLRVFVVALCLVQSARLARCRLAIASAGVGIPGDRSVRQQPGYMQLYMMNLCKASAYPRQGFQDETQVRAAD
jgi:hypothetical protein